MKPYIGITDFMSQKEVLAMSGVFDEIFPLGDRDLMVGTMMSYKTLHNIPTKWKDAFPKQEQFRDIYPSKRKNVLNTLHYADFGSTTEPQDLARAIIIAGHRGPFVTPFPLDAVQLDMVWPSKDLVQKAKYEAESIVEDSTKIENPLFDLKFILQIGARAMDIYENKPKKVASVIKSYGDSIHCVLFDRSGGFGKKMDPELLQQYVFETKMQCPEISIAVAGGLGPETMDLIVPLVEQFPDISIDAQGRLRRSGNALDPIDWDLAEKYLKEAGKIFNTKLVQ